MREQEFVAKIKEFDGMLRNSARRLCYYDTERQQDLIQNTLVRAWISRHQYSPEAGKDFGVWLYTILFHLAVDKRKSRGDRKARREVLSHELPTLSRFSDRASSSERLANLAHFKSGSFAPVTNITCEQVDESLSDEVTRALDKLIPKHRTMILLKAEGYRYEEIAKEMSIPLGTVRSGINSVRRICAQELHRNCAHNELQDVRENVEEFCQRQGIASKVLANAKTRTIRMKGDTLKIPRQLLAKGYDSAVTEIVEHLQERA